MKRFTGLLVLLLMTCVSMGAFASTSTLVADTKSGFVLASKDANEPNYPASLTKVMTLYLAFEALDNGLIKMDDKLPVSKYAAKQPKSKLYVKAGSTITVKEAILALIVKSANDVAVVLAEALAPSEAEFAQMMTKTAQELGMKNTTFKNASGLHNPNQITTAQDMAILTIAMIDHHPNYYPMFSRTSFYYKGKLVKGHNTVVKKYKGAEGLKTGFVSAVGYNIISTAKKGNNRLVTVVMGYNTSQSRDKQAMNLLDKGFKLIATQKQVASQSKKSLKNNPLGKQALVARPNKQSYLPLMEKTIQQNRNYAMVAPVAPTKTVAVADDRMLGVGYLDIEDFTDTEQGDGDSSWAIQVGAFSSEKQAFSAAQKAIGTLHASDMTIKTPVADELFRSRVLGFDTKRQADNACKKLRGKGMQCLPIAPLS